MSIITPIRSATQAARVDHPTGTATAAVTVLVWIAATAGLDIPAEVAAAIVGLAAVLVSAATPRFASAQVLADNDPPNGNTGPDPVADLDPSGQGEGRP